jgi:hypothetical protein
MPTFGELFTAYTTRVGVISSELVRHLKVNQQTILCSKESMNARSRVRDDVLHCAERLQEHNTTKADFQRARGIASFSPTRQTWAQALRSGKNPFDAETLESLRGAP